MTDRQTPSASSPLVAWIALAVGLIAAALWLATGPLAQNPGYHDFADQRSLLGVPHAWNVLSNVAFCVAGTWGLILLGACAQRRSFLGLVYGVFFLGVFATGLGSAYYHLGPDNATLIWDRLPMTVGFMAFTTLVIAERYSGALARRLFPWLLLAGVASVVYWGWADDLRPYVLVQFGPMLMLPVIIWRCAGPGTRWLWLTVAFYMLAKLLELADYEVLVFTEEVVSGHALKHLAAAIGAAMVVIKVRAGAVSFTSSRERCADSTRQRLAQSQNPNASTAARREATG